MKQNTKTMQEVFTRRSTRFFYKQHFYKQQQGLKLAKNKDIAKHPEADFLTKIFR